MKNRIRLTESQLHRVIKEATKKVLKEIGETNKFYDMLGASDAIATNNGDREKSRRAYSLSNKLEKHAMRNKPNGYDPLKNKEDARFHAQVGDAYGRGLERNIKESQADRRWDADYDEACKEDELNRKKKGGYNNGCHDKTVKGKRYLGFNYYE